MYCFMYRYGKIHNPLIMRYNLNRTEESKNRPTSTEYLNFIIVGMMIVY